MVVAVCRRAILLAAAIISAAVAAPLFAQQFRIVAREELDSLANISALENSPVRFEQTRIDAGTIDEDDAPSQYRFIWHNDGDTPLVITEVRTGCGCASAEYDKRPVKAGGKGEITISYRPKGHPGRFIRKIAVYTQLKGGPSAVLELAGYVTPSVKPTHNYPYSAGTLRLKQMQVKMSATVRSIESIEVLNAGDKPLRITADRRLLPEYVTVVCVPETIEAGAKGDIEICFDSAKAVTALPAQIPVILDGVGDIAPSKRTIYLRFE